MKNYTVNCFGFAGLTIRMENETPIRIRKNFLPFLEEAGTSPPDYVFRYESREELGDISGEILYAAAEFYVVRTKAGEFLRVSRDPKESGRVFSVARMDPAGERVEVTYLPGAETHFLDTNACFYHTGWEEAVNRKNRLILHAALIDTGFGGILFAGPSGAGKSTQAGLWEQLEGAVQINGDRPILYREHGVWLGCGSPYAGSSGCHVNRRVPVCAVFLPVHSKSCRLRRMSAAEAFRRVYSCCTVYSWDRRYVEGVLRMVTELVSDIPVYELFCTPDSSAVEIVKKELQAEGSG